ncbi:hypothetical protein [Paracoccus denitrificans]|uniref:hypothetical protein n=1 Tax=Paracoccus denitrificans TaxID=266 RepID=UPI00088165A1|nr:hypothetical protein [Paracoccus denitrificans]MBB4628860.1 hypothetical protein [Paracoccus denitrificans]MCU7429758.1 hypothetical protein [Paracoccus denitrificans]QAR25508.1 hypothetical protein EO213_03905 [Paracoccus denitrificans]UPV94401.1 hypothetical protein M0K93_11195 [Paracoccus denitrificans]WQO33555.1 hypothetical protein U0005_00250 [Paracoccus denitrificans]
MANHCHNTGVLPAASLAKVPDAERKLIAEKLRLALDEIETGRGDYQSVRNAVAFQREALLIGHRRLDRMEGVA